MTGSLPSTNYIAHAIDDLKDIFEDLRGREPRTADQLRKLVDLLRTAEKFMLPEGGLLLEVGHVRDSFIDLLLLPYPVIALEYRTAPAVENTPSMPNTYQPTKHIVLAWNGEAPTPWKLNSDELARGGTTSDQYLYFTSLTYDGEQGLWLPAPACFWFNRDELVLSSGGKAISGIHPIFPYPEWASRLKSSLQYEAALDAHIGPALFPLLEFCITINCENISSVEVPPSAPLNKKRKGAGKEPFDTYRVLTIPGEASEAGPGIGSHASPRLHLRRGHLRRLASGRVTWIRHTMVGAPDRGVVAKEYRVATDANP